MATVSRATWFGLFLSLFAMVVIRYVVVYFAYEITVGWAILKETLIWLSAATLLIIIRRGERLPFSSIGLGTSRWWKSVVWGLVTALVLASVVAGLAYLTGWRHGPGSAVSDTLPLRLIAFIVFRAGVVEELFYRGYPIKRLQMVGLGRFWSITIPLAIFSFAHWSGGAANVLIALAAGAILTGFYLWRRDLVANMIGHCLVSLLYVLAIRRAA
jgi:membrane protease YdiL (CAAX protease family)